MRINFRQGLVSSEIDGLSRPNYLSVSPSGISLRTTNRPVTFTVASGIKDYTVTFHEDVLAWPVSLFTDVEQAWLYVDINRATAARTYGITTNEPVAALAAPSSPVMGQHWFNTATKKMHFFNGTSWIHVIRVFAGTYTTTETKSMSVGSQVGISSGTFSSGSIMTDGFGRALKDSMDNFVTTEDVVYVDGAPTYAAKLESNVDVSTARENIAAYHVVRYTSGSEGVELADYDDTGSCILGLAVVNATLGEPVSLVLQGKVHNPMWDWGGANVTLWVNQTGQLVTTDPFLNGGRAKMRVPVGRTIDSKTIIFDQGMGGVGEKGDDGSVDGLPVASHVELGITRLSVAPADPDEPIAVGDNDPRLTDPRVPLEHTHPATAITVSPFGTFNGQNAQQALEHIQTVKLNLSGGTVTGPIVSTVQATQGNHLVTLGQAKNEITARAVTQKRYILNDTLPTIVQAFNALSPADRTLAVNTVVIVEYKGNVYMWSGGYGSPVSATDSVQFLLLGKLTTTATLTITALNAFAAFMAVTTNYLISFAYNAGTSSYTINLDTGEVIQVPDLPNDVGAWAMHEATGAIAFVTSVSDVSTTVHTLNVATITENGYEFIGQSNDYAIGFPYTGIGKIAFSGDGQRIVVTHAGTGKYDMIYATVFDTQTMAVITQIEPPIGYTTISGDGAAAALNKDGSLLAFRHGASTNDVFKLSVYQPNGAVVREYATTSMSQVLWFAEDGDGLEHLIAAEYDFYGTEGSKFHALPAASLPVSLPLVPAFTLPQTISVSYGAGQHTLESGDMVAYLGAYNNGTGSPIWYVINLNAGTFNELVLPEGDVWGWTIANTTDGKTIYMVTLNDQDLGGQATLIDPETHAYGAVVEFTIPDYISQAPFLI